MRETTWLRCGIALVVTAGLAVTFVARGANTRGERSGSRVEDRAVERRAIEQVLGEQEVAWNAGNVEKFMEGYWHSPELTFSGSSGVSRGWDGVLARYKKSYPDRATMGQLDFSELEFRFLGSDAALVLGRWHLKRDKGDIGGVFSLVWQRFPEGWKVIHDHTSAVEK
jgi:ketosteroid isomerase-like protein